MSYNLDNVRPGPARWKRAVDAAKRKPESYHAKLLFERLNRVKFLLRQRYWVVTRDDYTKTRHYYCSDFCFGLASHLEAWIESSSTLTHYSSYEDLIADIDDAGVGRELRLGWSRTLFPSALAIAPSSLPRAVKCFTCGGKMSRTEVTSIDPLVDFTYALSLARAYEPKTVVKEVTAAQLKDDTISLSRTDPMTDTVLLTEDGRILDERPQITEVQLTPRERVLLSWVHDFNRHKALESLKALGEL